MTDIWIGLAAVAGLSLIWIGIAYYRSRDWKAPPDGAPLRGMALPRGSVRALIALWLIGALIVFIFFGQEAVPDSEQYDKVLVSLGTLTATVAGYYFGARTGQSVDTKETPPPGGGGGGAGGGEGGGEGGGGGGAE